MLPLLQPILCWVRSRWDATHHDERGMTTETVGVPVDGRRS